jgi:hypothetical protein
MNPPLRISGFRELSLPWPHRGIAHRASRHRGIAASRHRGIAASRHRGIAES